MDHLVSTLSAAGYYTRHILQGDLLQLIEMIHHVNGSTRGACAIGEAELKKLNISYVCYHVETDRFALPDGYIGASHLHVLRAKVKAAIRIMHQIQCEGKPVKTILFGFMSLLSNTLFMMCLYENAQDGIREKELISRSYV